MLHYELITDQALKLDDGTVLYRIRTLVDLPEHGVVKGEIGGWIEKTDNLKGAAWVHRNARVSGNARVNGNAQVYGNAWVSGDAWVYGNARVSGDAQVYGNARVSGNAQVYGDAVIEKSTDVLNVGPALSSGRYTTAFTCKEGVKVYAGCFLGTVTEFEAAIEKTHANHSRHLNQYRAIAALIRAHFDL